MTTGWHEEQVAAVYHSHHDQLLRYVRRRTAERGIPDSLLDREGVVQETYLAALRHWPSIRNPGAWLYAVADNLINRASAEQARRAGPGLPGPGEPALPEQWNSMSPSLSVEDAVQVRLTLDSLGRLPGRQGLIVYLSKVHGWSHREIAEHLGIEPGGSRIHLLRGVRRLREQWAEIRSQGPEPLAASTGRRRWLVAAVVAWPPVATVLHATGHLDPGAALIGTMVAVGLAVLLIGSRWCSGRRE